MMSDVFVAAGTHAVWTPHHDEVAHAAVSHFNIPRPFVWALSGMGVTHLGFLIGKGFAHDGMYWVLFSVDAATMVLLAICMLMWCQG